MVKSWRTKFQIKEINPKMGFWRAKHGLNKHGLKGQNWSHVLGRRETVEREEQKERRRGRRWRSQDQAKRYGTLDFCMETNLDYGFYEIM